MKVLVVLGSRSDIDVARKCTDVLSELGIPYDVEVASAHRTPDRVRDLAARDDVDVFIAIAGLSAALPGVLAAHTARPVIGVPVSGRVNMDAILSMVQMPGGVPVGVVGLDRGDNAALLAASILSLSDESLKKRLAEYREKMAKKVFEDSEIVKKEIKRDGAGGPGPGEG